MIEVRKIPQLDGLTPKEIRRAWAKFMADGNDWGSKKSECVRLSIETLILNEGRESEEWARQNFNHFLRAYCTA